MLNEAQMKKSAKEFAEYWKDKGYEKGESQPFWLSLLRDIFGVEHPEQYIAFEDQVKLDHTSFIDGYIRATHVLIEQKGANKDLRKPIKQSDGSLLTPFQQAKRYSAELPYSERPRWIITCNFQEFLIYDMEKPNGEPESILLKDFGKEYYRLQFLVEEKSELIHREEQISIKAGDIVGKLYDAILKQYINPESEETLRSLNMLCVRLVFCLYAEDAGIFGDHLKFHNYIKGFAVKDVRRALIDLFRVLDTKTEDRDPYMDADLASFPYVNGGLFADENIEIPNFTDEIIDIILRKASEDFDWSEISPTIFGAVFESTLNPETRRSGGMHYTSIENIHKVIDPLFLDELRAELEEIKAVKVTKTRNDKADAFREKLSKLVFFDPACGSGNFLTQTYIELRKLENEALTLVFGTQTSMDALDDTIKVSIGQFYGIEINDFAVTVAKTALWIAESQMLIKTKELLPYIKDDFLPLVSYANIVEGNALRIDWETVVPKEKLNYIMGNPPFVANTGRISAEQSHSKKMMSNSQSDDRLVLFGKDGGVLDYVACWYKKSANLMKNTHIKTAFVSTDSITQGQQVEPLWKELLNEGLIINFAHTSFRWKNESGNKAAVVFVVIIGISYLDSKRYIYNGERVKEAQNINAYLMDAPNVIVGNRSKPLCNVPSMKSGGKPVEGGYLIFTDEEKEDFIKKEPRSSKYFRRFTSGETYIYNKMKWCLWLTDITPREINEMPEIKNRIRKVKEFRLNSSKEATKKAADFPHRFMEIKQPTTDYLIIPLTTSRNRRYIPIGYLPKDVIANNGASFVPNATLYHFGVLTSNVHMAWMRTVCGYFGPSYRYSNTIVYNNFPWCYPTDEQKAKIEQTAQAILDARALYPDCSLADLYDELTMPPELRKAHQANDKAVMQAYGFWGKLNTESECVAELMKMYQELTNK
ncbi:MAG: class I SAM-dependent DNA methyltransferase [Ruminococcaceae bacterium]|nr:class I SAM-dependent DNA methyltransferase [Oscillospiraceae bacterium]